MTKKQIDILMRESEKRVERSNAEVEEISKNVKNIIKRLNMVL